MPAFAGMTDYDTVSPRGRVKVVLFRGHNTNLLAVLFREIPGEIPGTQY
jgi:hypothetical protein